ncbi:hypothetical protein MPSEU_000619300 [Mayamaea pseudoterrestris]|nr:hypothetical protein MPSEU_000619300 [Mayamaea pseudoterrestris]
MHLILSSILCLVATAAVFATSLFLLPTPVIDSAKQTLRTTSASIIATREQFNTAKQSNDQQPLLDLHICRASLANVSKKPYICDGPAYDDFTTRMLNYANRQDSTTWGRRKFPLPNNTYVFMLGNSHTRQVFNTLLCEYQNVISSSRSYNDSFGASSESTFGFTMSHHFANNATLVTVSNSPLVYNEQQWAKTFENLLDRSLESMDAVIMGRFNHFETTSKYGREITAYSQSHPELFDDSYTSPTIESLAAMYKGPVIAVPMFAPHGQDVAESALRAIHYHQNETLPPRTNIRLVHARKHVEILGECGSDVHSDEPGICRNTGDNHNGGNLREPEAMHRCTGMKGGHPDLVAWDIVEELYDLLE